MKILYELLSIIVVLLIIFVWTTQLYFYKKDLHIIFTMFSFMDRKIIEMDEELKDIKKKVSNNGKD